MTVKSITAWVRGDETGAKSAEKLRVTMARLTWDAPWNVEPRPGYALAEVEIANRAHMQRVRSELLKDFGQDFSLEQAGRDNKLAVEELIRCADAAARKVGCERVGLAQPLTDSLGEARGARIYYAAPAMALRRVIREAGLEMDQEQVRIRVDVWQPIADPSTQPKTSSEVTPNGSAGASESLT